MSAKAHWPAKRRDGPRAVVPVVEERTSDVRRLLGVDPRGLGGGVEAGLKQPNHVGAAMPVDDREDVIEVVVAASVGAAAPVVLD